MIKFVVAAMLAFLLLGGMLGCAPAPMVAPPEAAQVPPPKPHHIPTAAQIRLKNALLGREDMSSAQVAELSDQLVADPDALNNQETMARLELLILKTMKSSDKSHRATLWRSLGIIHYHQHKYKQARQELQAANELNPQNARTHFYLACLFAHQGNIYERLGKRRISQQQFKRASIEIGMARKLDPHNPLYKKNARQIIQQENGT
jgi:tetratricopeptide (TPR) repeat protein